MGVAIGGRHTVVVATTIPTREHTVAPITGATVIIIQPLTMTPQRELTGGNRLLMVRTDRRLAGPLTTLTLGPMLEAPASRHLTAAEAQPRHTTPTRVPMRRPDKVQLRTLNGVVPVRHV